MDQIVDLWSKKLPAANRSLFFRIFLPIGDPRR